MLKFALIFLVFVQLVQYLVITRRALFKPGPMVIRFRPRDAVTYGLHYGLIIWVLLAVLNGARP